MRLRLTKPLSLRNEDFVHEIAKTKRVDVAALERCLAIRHYAQPLPPLPKIGKRVLHALERHCMMEAPFDIVVQQHGRYARIDAELFN